MVLEGCLYAGERLCSVCGFSISGTRTGFSANACRLRSAGPALCSVAVIALSVAGSAYTLQLLGQKPPDWCLSCAGRQVGLENPPGEEPPSIPRLEPFTCGCAVSVACHMLCGLARYPVAGVIPGPTSALGTFPLLMLIRG